MNTNSAIAVLRQHLTQIEGTKVVPVAPIAKALGYPRGRELSRACSDEAKRYIQIEGRPTSLAVTLDGFIQMVFRSSKPELVALQGALVGLMAEGLSNGNEGRDTSPGADLEDAQQEDPEGREASPEPEAETEEGQDTSPSIEPEGEIRGDQEGRDTSPAAVLSFDIPEVKSLRRNTNGMYRSLVEAYNHILNQSVDLPDHLAPWNWIEAHVPQFHDIAEREGLPSALDLASFSNMHRSAWARDDVAQMYLDDIKTWGLSASSN